MECYQNMTERALCRGVFGNVYVERFWNLEGGRDNRNMCSNDWRGLLRIVGGTRRWKYRTSELMP